MAIIATGAGAIVIGGVIAGAGTAVTGKLAKFADGTGIAAGGPRFDSGVRRFGDGNKKAPKRKWPRRRMPRGHFAMRGDQIGRQRPAYQRKP